MQLWPSGRLCDDITTASAASFGVERLAVVFHDDRIES